VFSENTLFFCLLLIKSEGGVLDILSILLFSLSEDRRVAQKYIF